MLHFNSYLINYLDCLNACKGRMLPTVKIPQSSGAPASTMCPVMENSSKLKAASVRYQNMIPEIFTKWS